MPARRIEWDIPVPAHYYDHRFEGRAVLPAVVALRHLAAAVDRLSGQAACNTIAGARFERLLPLPEPPGGGIEALIELSPGEGSQRHARLMTRRVAGRSGISRLLTHVQAVFDHREIGAASMAPPAPGKGADTQAFIFPAARLYSDLVPFGPAFRNVIDTIALAPGTASAAVRAPQWPGDHSPICNLGSPYPLDAAFHVACTWGQRFAACVPFPVGFERLVVAAPTTPGADYRCHVFARGRDAAQMVFDIDIFARSGVLAERLEGLRMQDIRRHRPLPPDWIAAAVS